MDVKQVSSQTRQKGCLPSLIFALVIFTWYLFVGEIAGNNRLASIGLFWGGLLVCFPIIYLFKKLAIKRYTDQVRHAHHLMKQDQRKPVFYLRSFDSDAHQHEKISTAQMVGMVNPFVLVAYLLAIKPTFEQKLNMIAGQIGPVIALARPGSGKMLGVARLDEARDEDWQDIVKDFLDKSQLIVMRAGDTGGLLWEIQTIFTRQMLEHLVIVLEFDGDQTPEILKARYNKFARQVKEETGVEFPEYEKHARYLYFKDGTTPTLQKSLGETLKCIGKTVESKDFISYAKGWLPTGWNSARGMSITKNIPTILARIIGLVVALTACALITRWSWYWVTEYDFGEGTGTLIMLTGILLFMFQGAFLPKILARFKWRNTIIPKTLGLIFIAWSMIWFLDGTILGGDFGMLLTDFELSWQLITDHLDKNGEFLFITGLFIWLPHLFWLMSFKIYGLSDYEAQLYDIKI